MGAVDWTRLTRSGEKWQTVINSKMNIWAQENESNF